MDTASRNEVFEKNSERLMKTGGISASLRTSSQAATRNLKLTCDVLVMIATVVIAWFVWRQVLPYLWPAGPELLIAPGFWLFMGGSVIARAVWSILFLCPKIR